MQYRTFPGSDVRTSAVGFGLWTVSTGWWGQYTDEEAVALMRLAFDRGVTLFDAADSYGDGRSEELIPKAFPGRRDEIVVATKIGYDSAHFGAERRGQRAIPQDFSVPALERAIDRALERLKTDRIDLLQLHNITMDVVEDDAVWECMERAKASGKVRLYGFALGPAIGWLGEGVRGVRERDVAVVQHIYNLLEQHPGKAIQRAAEEAGRGTMFLVRVPHSSGMLEGKYTAETKFPPGDHRSHRPRSWLLNGVKKVEQLRFLEREGRTLGQAAIQWLLDDPRVASVLPNIYDAAQVEEFAAAPDTAPLTAEELARVEALYAAGFGLEEEPCKFKGTMELAEAAAR